MKFDNHNCRPKLTKDSSQKTMAKTNFLIANSKPSLSKWCEKKMGLSKSHKLPNIYSWEIVDERLSWTWTGILTINKNNKTST